MNIMFYCFQSNYRRGMRGFGGYRHWFERYATLNLLQNGGLSIEWNSQPATFRGTPYFRYPCKAALWKIAGTVWIGA